MRLYNRWPFKSDSCGVGFRPDLPLARYADSELARRVEQVLLVADRTHCGCLRERHRRRNIVTILQHREHARFRDRDEEPGSERVRMTDECRSVVVRVAGGIREYELL